VAPVLVRNRASWVGMWTDDDQGSGVVVFVTARLTGKGRSVSELYELGTDLQSLLAAVGGDSHLSARTAADLVKAGLVELLLGQPESLWLLPPLCITARSSPSGRPTKSRPATVMRVLVAGLRLQPTS
jgi:hypothetical protein